MYILSSYVYILAVSGMNMDPRTLYILDLCPLSINHLDIDLDPSSQLFVMGKVIYTF